MHIVHANMQLLLGYENLDVLFRVMPFLKESCINELPDDVSKSRCYKEDSYKFQQHLVSQQQCGWCCFFTDSETNNQSIFVGI